PSAEASAVRAERLVREDGGDEPLDGLLVVVVRPRPGRMDLRLANGLLRVALHPLDVDRPRADERLIEQVLEIAVGPVGLSVALVDRERLSHGCGRVVRHPRDQRYPALPVLRAI